MQTHSAATAYDEQGQRDSSVGPRPRSSSIRHGHPKYLVSPRENVVESQHLRSRLVLGMDILALEHDGEEWHCTQ